MINEISVYKKYTIANVLNYLEDYALNWNVEDYRTVLGADYNKNKEKIMHYKSAADSEKLSMLDSFALLNRSLGPVLEGKVICFAIQKSILEANPADTDQQGSPEELNFSIEFSEKIIPSSEMPKSILDFLETLLPEMNDGFFGEANYSIGDPLRVKHLAWIDTDYLRKFRGFGPTHQKKLELICSSNGFDITHNKGLYEGIAKNEAIKGRKLGDALLSQIKLNFPEFSSIGDIFDFFPHLVPCRGLTQKGIRKFTHWLRCNGFNPTLVGAKELHIMITNIYSDNN